MATARRVLLVEDDDDTRELMTEVLVAAGYRVTTAPSGAEGLRALASEHIDVVLTDVGMPGVGGLEVARGAKAIAPHVPVLVLTGYSNREDLERARGREVDAVLLKPIDPDELAGAVAAALGGPGRG